MTTLSIILPTYNIEQYLRQCLDSVVNQTYTDLEIIIIDDNSTDSTPEIIREYAAKDSRIKSIFHTTNAGPGPTRNEGLKIATGAYVTLMDHDDWQDLDKYEKMMAKAAKHNADIVFCNAQEYNQDTGLMNKSYFVAPKMFAGGGVLKANTEQERWSMARMICAPWAKVVKMGLVRKYDIKFSSDDNRFDDVLYHYHTCMFAKKVYFLDEILYTHRMFPLSISGASKKNPDMMFDLFKTWGELESVCLKNSIEPGRLFVYYSKILGNSMYRVRNYKAYANKMNALFDKYDLKGEDFPEWYCKFYRNARNYSLLQWLGYKLWNPIRRTIKRFRGFFRRQISR